ncbi:MAG: family 1 encapsulin nanocompartment shell protein [Anaerolineae bacterium]
MANKYLSREDAPISAAVWEKLDATMIEAAKSQLVGRRLLYLEGPYGLGLKTIPLEDAVITAAADSPEVVASSVIPVSLIRTTFVLGTRDLASYERDGVALDLHKVVEAAIACARLEDDLVFNGMAKLRVPGLLNVPGNNKVKLSAWEKTGDAAEDLIKALTVLDSNGFHGPYSLALAPSRYNLLFRRYPQGNQTEMEHLQSIVTAGIFKAPIFKDGGVLLASGLQYASIVIGQDMSIGFIGPAAGDLEFSISESLALRVRQPKSICVLEA